MKKVFSFIFIIIMLASFAIGVSAEDDGVVNYMLILETDKSSYDKGEEISVTISVKDLVGTDCPDLYALGGSLYYDSFLMEYTGASFAWRFDEMLYSNDADS